jgi:hypothetical protein
MDEERIKALEARIAALEEQMAKPITVRVSDEESRIEARVKAILNDPRNR